MYDLQGNTAENVMSFLCMNLENIFLLTINKITLDIHHCNEQTWYNYRAAISNPGTI